MGSYTYQTLRSLETEHLYRHLSEVVGKDTRGGYLDGQLVFSEHLLSAPFGLKVVLISDVHPKTQTSGRVHPNLLYMTRFESKKRRQELESLPMWRIDLEIRDGSVLWWTESEAQALYSQEVCQLKADQETGIRNILDLKDLHLTVITPLVRTNVNGIKVKDALAKRKPLFENLEDHEWEDVLYKLDKFYTSKDNKSEMDKICLQFNLHNIIQSEEGEDKEEPWMMFDQSLISPPICNSKSRTLGSFDLIPDTVSAQKACSKNPRTIYLPSQFKLPMSEKDAYPRFVVKTKTEEYQLDTRVKQPVDHKIFATQIFIFKTPIQEEEKIQQIYSEGAKIYLEVFRPKDKATSNIKFEFDFKIHQNLREGTDFPDLDLCPLCLEDPDRLVLESNIQSLQDVFKTSGLAKPGTKRRKRNPGSLFYPSSISPVVSPGLTSDSGIQDNSFSPESNDSLFQVIEESNFNIDIDDLLYEVPDVLMDVPDMIGYSSEPPGAAQSPLSQGSYPPLLHRGATVPTSKPPGSAPLFRGYSALPPQPVGGSQLSSLPGAPISPSGPPGAPSTTSPPGISAHREHIPAFRDIKSEKLEHDLSELDEVPVVNLFRTQASIADSEHDLSVPEEVPSVSTSCNSIRSSIVDSCNSGQHTDSPYAKDRSLLDDGRRSLMETNHREPQIKVEVDSLKSEEDLSDLEEVATSNSFSIGTMTDSCDRNQHTESYSMEKSLNDVKGRSIMATYYQEPPIKVEVDSPSEKSFQSPRKNLLQSPILASSYLVSEDTKLIMQNRSECIEEKSMVKHNPITSVDEYSDLKEQDWSIKDGTCKTQIQRGGERIFLRNDGKPSIVDAPKKLEGIQVFDNKIEDINLITEDEEDRVEPRVLELSKKFGGATKKCLKQISRSSKKIINYSDSDQMISWRPFVFYMLTPIIIILAFYIQQFWTPTGLEGSRIVEE